MDFIANSIFPIFFGLALLMFLAYRGHSIIWIAPLCAAVVAFLSGLPIIQTYIATGLTPEGTVGIGPGQTLMRSYMRGTAEFFVTWFPAFLFGAIYGKLMDMTGSARSLADKVVKLVGQKNAVLAVVLPCMLMTYGGISLFVVVFAIYPMGYAIYRSSNLPRHLLPAAIAFGAFGITMTTIPGTPQIQNLIPMQSYGVERIADLLPSMREGVGTTPMAAVEYSIIGALLMAIPGFLFLDWQTRKARKLGENFVEDPKFTEVPRNEELPSWHWLAGLIPIVTVVVVLNVLRQHILVALFSGIALCCLMNYRQWKILAPSISQGANGSLVAIMNTSCAVGFGAVVQLVPGFEILSKMMLELGGNILFSQAVAVNVLAGATGSASGGMSIALTALAGEYVTKAYEIAAGDPERFQRILELLHRGAAQASGGLDTLPHNGAVLTLLAVSNLTHKESYKGIFVANLLIPTIVSLLLALVWGFFI